MANTYDPTLASDRDRVRYLIGDVDDPWLLSDEEIDAELATYGDDELSAAIGICTALIARFTRKSTSASVGPFTIDYATTAAGFRQLRDDLIDRQSSEIRPSPYLSGAEADQEQDGDMRPFLFDVGMGDNLYSETYEGSRSPTGWPQ